MLQRKGLQDKNESITWYETKLRFYNQKLLLCFSQHTSLAMRPKFGSIIVCSFTNKIQLIYWSITKVKPTQRKAYEFLSPFGGCLNLVPTTDHYNRTWHFIEHFLNFVYKLISFCLRYSSRQPPGRVWKIDNKWLCWLQNLQTQETKTDTWVHRPNHPYMLSFKKI